MKKNLTPSFWKWTLKSSGKRGTLIFLILFSMLGRLYMYTDLVGIPCDDGFLFGFWRHLDELPITLIIVYEFFTTIPLGLVILSFWGLYKANVLFKAAK